MNSFDKEYGDWIGIPNYSELLTTLEFCDQLYVFANYQCHLFSYAIHLHPSASQQNDVYILCGKDYRIIANSFSEFIKLYLEDSIELYFSDEGTAT